MSFRLAKVFCDGMILQRDVPVNIWGEAEYPVTVSIDCHTAVDFARDGKFSLTIPPHKAGGPYTLFIESEGAVKKIHDVYFGDVFLAGGQSNMAFFLEDVFQPVDESEHPVRMFTPMREWEYSRRPETDDRWIEVCDENRHGLSATASHFAKAISGRYGVPVGILNCNQGATAIRSWISYETLALDPIIKDFGGWHPDADDFPFNAPAHQYNERLRDLAPYNVLGVIWYQGESDSYDTVAPYYGRLFGLMTSDWRRIWQNESLPFITVQLANFRPDDKREVWEIVREQQLWCSENIPNVGMVTNGDLGDPFELHPRDKKSLGERLARYAEGMIYGEDILYRPAVCREAVLEDGAVILKFSDAGDGLYADEHLSFSVTNAGGESFTCEYELAGDTVRLSTDAIDPREVRFCFDCDSAVHLFSSASLPASPFRMKIKKM